MIGIILFWKVTLWSCFFKCQITSNIIDKKLQKLKQSTSGSFFYLFILFYFFLLSHKNRKSFQTGCSVAVAGELRNPMEPRCNIRWILFQFWGQYLKRWAFCTVFSNSCLGSFTKRTFGDSKRTHGNYIIWSVKCCVLHTIPYNTFYSVTLPYLSLSLCPPLMAAGWEDCKNTKKLS